ncbi:alpha/beta fold hydrolase, partial [Streptomyces sp. NPDC003832]
LAAPSQDAVRDRVEDDPGTLHSQPSLACPEIDRFNATAVGLPYDAPSTGRGLVRAAKACRDRLTDDGIDLAAYNTIENAADFAALRKALGIRKWNVYGYSYGTDLGLTYLRRHPEGIRSLAIDSVVPPQTVSLPWAWDSAQEGINAIFAACEAQPACAARYPDLSRTLTRQVRRLEANPLRLTVPPPGGGTPVDVVLDGGTLVNLLVANGRLVPPADVPAALYELAAGNPERLAQAQAAGATPAVGEFAHGLTHSVACAEWAPGFSKRDVLAAGRRAFPGWPDSVLVHAPQLPFEHDLCRAWNVPDRTPVQRVATHSEVPALIVTGTFDAKTGASWGPFAGRTLPRSTAVVALRPGGPGGRTPRLSAHAGTVLDGRATARGAGEPTTARYDAPGEPGAGPDGATRGDTCHLDVVDRWGNMIAATPSGGWLQSNPVVPELGFPLGTRLQMTWLEEGLPAALTPGRRPRTTLSPSLALRDGEPVLAFGTPGGDQQDQWQLHFFLGVALRGRVRGGLDLQGAIDAPNWHNDSFPSSFHPRGMRPGSVTVESRTDPAVVDELIRRGHRVTVAEPWSEGRLCAVARDPRTGLLSAAANPRGMQGYAVGR